MQEIGTLWTNLNIGLGLIIFLAYLVIDALYAHYTYSVVNKEPVRAATTGFVMHFLLAVGVINYVDNYLYVLPLAVGSWVGTYVIVMREKNKR